jgi:hypothetical protein
MATPSARAGLHGLIAGLAAAARRGDGEKGRGRRIFFVVAAVCVVADELGRD